MRGRFFNLWNGYVQVNLPTIIFFAYRLHPTLLALYGRCFFILLIAKTDANLHMPFSHSLLTPFPTGRHDAQQPDDFCLQSDNLQKVPTCFS